jgi:hypothetical protein
VGISLEMATENVPQDGRYYVLDGGRVVKSCATLHQAAMEYERLRARHITSSANDHTAAREWARGTVSAARDPRNPRRKTADHARGT